MNYNAIVSHVAEKLDRDDLTDMIPVYINTALRTLEKTYDFRYMRTRNHSASPDSEGRLTLPVRYKNTDFLFVTINGQKFGPLIKEDLKDAEMQFKNVSEGISQVFSSDSTYLYLLPTPYTGAVCDWAYHQYSAEMGSTNLTNWVGDTAPEVLIYGACLEAMPDLVEDVRMALWEHKYDKAVNAITAVEHKERFSGHQYVKPGVVV